MPQERLYSRLKSARSFTERLLEDFSDSNSWVHQVTPDAGELKGRLDEGFTFVAYGTDLLAMRHALAGVRDLT